MTMILVFEVSALGKLKWNMHACLCACTHTYTYTQLYTFIYLWV